MTGEIIPFYDALIFGTLLASLDKMGLSPKLVERETARMLDSEQREIFKQIMGKEEAPTRDGFLAYAKKLSENVGKDIEVAFSENGFYVKINECMWLETAKFTRPFGYDSCPFCTCAYFDGNHKGTGFQ